MSTLHKDHRDVLIAPVVSEKSYGLLDANKVGSVQDVIEKRAYFQFYMHRTGHWLGMDVHDCGSYVEPSQVGEVSERKGSFTLVRAWARVAPRVPDARLVLAGQGALDEVRTLARSLGVEGSLELVGWVAGEQKRALLERAGVLVHPSLAEALPMAVLEALAAGRPVVASDRKSTRLNSSH